MTGLDPAKENKEVKELAANPPKTAPKRAPGVVLRGSHTPWGWVQEIAVAVAPADPATFPLIKALPQGSAKPRATKRDPTIRAHRRQGVPSQTYSDELADASTRVLGA